MIIYRNDLLYLKVFPVPHFSSRIWKMFIVMYSRRLSRRSSFRGRLFFPDIFHRSALFSSSREFRVNFGGIYCADRSGWGERKKEPLRIYFKSKFSNFLVAGCALNISIICFKSIRSYFTFGMLVHKWFLPEFHPTYLNILTDDVKAVALSKSSASPRQTQASYKRRSTQRLRMILL